MAEDGAQYIEDEVGVQNILNKLRVELDKKTAHPLPLSSGFLPRYQCAKENFNSIPRQPGYFRFFNSICLLASGDDFIMLYARQNKQIFSFYTFALSYIFRN